MAGAVGGGGEAGTDEDTAKAELGDAGGEGGGGGQRRSPWTPPRAPSSVSACQWPARSPRVQGLPAHHRPDSHLLLCDTGDVGTAGPRSRTLWSLHLLV